MDPKTVRPTRMALVASFAALCTIGFVPGCSGDSGATSRAKHLILISVDTLNASRLGCYGGPNSPSPAIDRLAAEGVRFDRAYVPRGMTLPSMTTYFTSKYPADHGVIDNKHKIPYSEWMLAERLEKSDFKRLAFNASDVLAVNPKKNTAIEQGFGDKAYTTLSDDDVGLTKVASNYLRTKFGRNPKREFVWVHLMSPHKPFAPRSSDVDRFDPGYTGEWNATAMALEPLIERSYVERKPPTPEQLRHFLAIYDGEVATVDRCVAELLAALDASGAANDTLVVFVADHGEELFAHNDYPYHANSPYRSVTRVPWIMRQASGVVPAGRVVGDVIESVDFLPTALSWLGLPDMIPGDRDENAPRGRDLTPLVLGTAPLEPRAAFGRNDDCADRPQNLGLVTLRDQRWSLIVNTDCWLPDFPPKEGLFPVPPLALYDLDVDPDEQHDVSAQHPEVVARMRAEAEARAATLLHRRNPFIDAAKDPEEIAKMIELGYLQKGAATTQDPDRERDPNCGKGKQ